MYSIVLSIEKLKEILSGCLADDKFQQDISGKDLKRMIETIRLFDEDSHQTLFEGCVLSCEQDGDLYKITLNQTMFSRKRAVRAATEAHSMIFRWRRYWRRTE